MCGVKVGKSESPVWASWSSGCLVPFFFFSFLKEFSRVLLPVIVKTGVVKVKVGGSG